MLRIAMAAAPDSPTVAREQGSVIVFAIGPNPEQSATREMLELCRRNGAEPMVLDATVDPLFADHLTDPRTREHFPLLCVEGALVGGLEVVRLLASQRRLALLFAPESSHALPRVAISLAAAEEFRRALTDQDACIRIVVTPSFEHDLTVDTEGPSDLKIMLGDIPVVMDVESANRADGLAIDWVDSADGKAFRVDNPNRPREVQSVDLAWLEKEGTGIGLLVIDVRTTSEYEQEHLDGARLLDATMIDALDQLDRATPLLFYCGTGIRSRKAAERYRELGFCEVYCLKLGATG